MEGSREVSDGDDGGGDDTVGRTWCQIMPRARHSSGCLPVLSHLRLNVGGTGSYCFYFKVEKIETC